MPVYSKSLCFKPKCTKLSLFGGKNMYATIQNKYGEAESYAKPVVSQPIPKDIFMGYIREVVEKEYDCSNVTRNNLRMRANILEHYLNKYGINEVAPDEQFIK